MRSIIDIRKQERGVMKKSSTKRKFRNKTRRVCEEVDCYLHGYLPFKRTRRQGEKDENLVVTSDHIIFKGNFLHMMQRVWIEI